MQDLLVELVQKFNIAKGHISEVIPKVQPIMTISEILAGLKVNYKALEKFDGNV